MFSFIYVLWSQNLEMRTGHARWKARGAQHVRPFQNKFANTANVWLCSVCWSLLNFPNGTLIQAQDLCD